MTRMDLEKLVGPFFPIALKIMRFSNLYESTRNLKKAAYYSGLYDLLYKN
jgi:hypothetical protein